MYNDINLKVGIMKKEKKQRENRKLSAKLLAVIAVLAIATVATIVVIVYLVKLPKVDDLPELGIVKYPVCPDSNIASDESLDRYDDSAELRCLTDRDRQIVSRATYTPLTGDSVMDYIDEQVFVGQGENCNTSDNYCEHTMSGVQGKQWVKQVLDRMIGYTNGVNLGAGSMSHQVVSTIDETSTEYIYTYYLTSPAYAECVDWDYELPPGMTIYKIPSYSVEFGETCKGKDEYTEYRGVTRVGIIKINKANPIVKLTRGSEDLYLDESQETVLVHDDTHYIHLGDKWCQGEIWCDKE